MTQNEYSVDVAKAPMQDIFDYVLRRTKAIECPSVAEGGNPFLRPLSEMANYLQYTKDMSLNRRSFVYDVIRMLDATHVYSYNGGATLISELTKQAEYVAEDWSLNLNELNMETANENSND